MVDCRYGSAAGAWSTVSMCCKGDGLAACISRFSPSGLWIYTMNRCFLLSLRTCVTLLVAWGGVQHAFAQIDDLQPQPFTGVPNDHRQRPFSLQAERGRVAFTAPPDVQLNGKAARLSPGARIFTERRMLTTGTKLIGQEREVFYTTDNMGRLHDIWLLTEKEQSLPTPKQKREMLTGVQRTDRQRNAHLRNVPFDELPKYGESSGSGTNANVYIGN